jgi:DNA-directed RNA polymerase specialized sigma24 family protein
MPEPDRIERLLALLLLAQMKGVTQREKIHQLNLAGFSNTEIADLLETTPAVVGQRLREARAKAASRRRKGR